MSQEVDKYLIAEYAGQTPQSIEINGQKIIIPHAYTKEKYGIDKFWSDYFDANIEKEIGLYQKHNQEPSFTTIKTSIGNIEAPLPFDKTSPSVAVQCFADYQEAVLLTKELNLKAGHYQGVKIGLAHVEELKNTLSLAEKQKAKQSNSFIKQKLIQARKKIVIGAIGLGVVGGVINKISKDNDKDTTQSLNDQEARFQRILKALMREEGGYATKESIDQETNFGIINATLKSFKENYPEHSKGFPDSLKDLSTSQAKTIIRVGFYEENKIDKLENESIAKMLLDISFNHQVTTRREFVKQGVVAVMVERGEDPEKRPKQWADVIDFVNNCDEVEQKTFYDATSKARLDFLSRPGYVDKYVGLLDRAERFVGGYEPNKDTKPRTYAATITEFHHR